MNQFDAYFQGNNNPNLVSQPAPQSPHAADSLYFFYQSLRIVLIMWILLLIIVIVAPWATYYVKKKIQGNPSQTISTGNANSGSVVSQAPTSFYVKKGDLEINAPVVEGISNEDLTKGIGHHPESVWPNQKGNVILAGHSSALDPDNIFGEVFARLRDLEIGDEASVNFQGKTYTYKIFNKQKVSPGDNRLLGKADKWQLTFYTCDPPKTDWYRIVLQAELVQIK